MSYLDNPILVEARKADLRLLSEKKIDAKIEKILDAERINHRKSFSDYQYEKISSKSVYGFVQKSAKQLLSLMNSNSKVKNAKSPDDNKLTAILENQKILAALLVKIGRNMSQLNEIVGDSE